MSVPFVSEPELVCNNIDAEKGDHFIHLEFEDGSDPYIYYERTMSDIREKIDRLRKRYSLKELYRSYGKFGFDIYYLAKRRDDIHETLLG